VTAFEANRLIKPPAPRGVSDYSFLFPLHCGDPVNLHLKKEYPAVMEALAASPARLVESRPNPVILRERSDEESASEGEGKQMLRCAQHDRILGTFMFISWAEGPCYTQFQNGKV
jgi:hypothetical protein